MPKKKSARMKIAFEVGKPRPIEGRKDKLYQVNIKRGGARLSVGEFLARTEADARKQARAVIRRELGGK